jgi:hypoxanthine phosphoribosyltransferase
MQRVDADFAPTLLVGIKNGGLVVAETMARFAASRPPVMPLTSRRAATGTKSRLPLLRTMLLALPMSARDLLRRVEHRYFIAPRAQAGRQQYVDQTEANAIRQHLSANSGPERVLVVDDAVDSGVTLGAVLHVLRDIALPGTEMRAAVITQTLDNPTVRPDYALHHGTLCRFPWSFDAAA